MRELQPRLRDRSMPQFQPGLPRSARLPRRFCILAQKAGDRVKLITRNGYEFAECYPLIVDPYGSKNLVDRQHF
jgi:hypothetical protein